jgi:hypothetical protein
VETKMMLRLSEFIAWFACIFGVSGSIGLKKDGKEVNAHVMAVCMIH